MIFIVEILRKKYNYNEVKCLDINPDIQRVLGDLEQGLVIQNNIWYYILKDK